MSWPGGLYGSGMHDFILDEALLGTRVAQAQDNEDCGFGALFDLSYAEYVAAHPANPDEPTEKVISHRA